MSPNGRESPDEDPSFDSKETYQYEYDSNGNWTKKIEFEVKNEVVKTPKYIFERKIEYYD